MTPDVLIPRPETEQLVVRALDLAKEMKRPEPLQVADVGTGSGAIAVCVAKHCPQAHVTAVDISRPALALAERNAKQHAVAERIKFLEGNLLSGLPATDMFSLVVSNPPYVSTAEMSELPPDVRDHEPHLALDGGAAGTQVIERLIPQAAAHLRPGGWLLLEVGAANASRVETLVSQHADFQLHDTLKDLASLPRIVQAQRK